jgi:hypothetical protein
MRSIGNPSCSHCPQLLGHAVEAGHRRVSDQRTTAVSVSVNGSVISDSRSARRCSATSRTTAFRKTVGVASDRCSSRQSVARSDSPGSGSGGLASLASISDACGSFRTVQKRSRGGTAANPQPPMVSTSSQPELQQAVSEVALLRWPPPLRGDRPREQTATRTRMPQSHGAGIRGQMMAVPMLAKESVHPRSNSFPWRSCWAETRRQ